MNKEKLSRMIAGIDPWKDNFGQGMEQRGNDNMSWYDLSVNCNSIPCETDTAIIVTAWQGQLKWLDYVLAQYRLSGAFVILAYDNPFYAWCVHSQDMLRYMPHPKHYVLANSVVHKHITYDGDKRNGWFWDVRYAQGILRNFPNIKHVYMTNGDCTCDKPEGFKDVIALLGDDDLMSGQSDEGIIHTADVIFKAESFHKIFDHMAEQMRVPIVGSRSPEKILLNAVKALDMKVQHAPLQPIEILDGTSVDYYTRQGQDSTWKQLLGYRNLFAEQEESWNYGGQPVDRKYVDNYQNWIYFSGEERATICKYYDTNDKRYLYMWWDRGEDSWYNRLYMPIEHYGDKPVYGEANEGFSFHRK